MELKVRTKDKYVIHGTIDMPKKKTDTCIVFIHGLMGYMNESKFLGAKEYFTKKGIATARFSLYTTKEDSRKLGKSTVATHVSDSESVIKEVSKHFKKIYVVGHSLGGPVACLVNKKNVRAIILWDPTLRQASSLDKKLKYIKQLDSYIISWGYDFLM